MKIYLLHPNPAVNARHICDVHLHTALQDAATMLSHAYPESMVAIPRTNKYKNPFSVWARTTDSNLEWLCKYSWHMCIQYYQRFDKGHKDLSTILWCSNNRGLITIDSGVITPMPQAIPDKYKSAKSVVAYRRYYAAEKRHFAKWRLGEPYWWDNYVKEAKEA